MRALLIVLMCVAAASTYGVLLNQVTVRLCVEYFTVGPDSTGFSAENPTLLALGQGIAATWWVGLLLGVALAVAARAGRRPPRTPRSLLRPIIGLLIIMAVLATLAGFAGYTLARGKVLEISPALAEKVPAETQPRYIACFFAHTASYWVGFVGGGVQIAIVWGSRRWLRPERRQGRG